MGLGFVYVLLCGVPFIVVRFHCFDSFELRKQSVSITNLIKNNQSIKSIHEKKSISIERYLKIMSIVSIRILLSNASVKIKKCIDQSKPFQNESS